MKIKVSDRNFEKKFETSLMDLIKDSINDDLEEMAGVVEDYYGTNRDYFELVTLKSEAGDEEIYKRVETELEIIHNKDTLSFNISVNTDKIGDLVLRAQQTGSGLNMNQKILDYLGVNEDVAEDKYFDPKPTDIVFKNDLKTILKGKKD